MSNFVIFKDNQIAAGSIKLDDVPKYVPILDKMYANGHHELADTALAKMLETEHPLAMIYKADKLINEGNIEEGTELIQKAVKTKHIDALLNYGSWVLRGRINPDDVESALAMLKEVAQKGHNELIIAAPAYYLKRIALGFDHVENNARLNEWLEIWNPKLCKKFKKGRITQKELLTPISKEAGLVEVNDADN